MVEDGQSSEEHKTQSLDEVDDAVDTVLDRVLAQCEIDFGEELEAGSPNQHHPTKQKEELTHGNSDGHEEYIPNRVYFHFLLKKSIQNAPRTLSSSRGVVRLVGRVRRR